jgi:hypothetical protein
MLDQVGNLVVGPTFVERVFRPGRRSFLDHRLINYCNGLQVALLADDVDEGDSQGLNYVPDAPPDVVVESGVKFPRMTQCAAPPAQLFWALFFYIFFFVLIHFACRELVRLMRLQVRCSARGSRSAAP